MISTLTVSCVVRALDDFVKVSGMRHIKIGFLVLMATYMGLPAKAMPQRVVVSLPPQKWFAQQLLPDAEVTVLLRPGDNPHTYAPTPSQIRDLAKADLWLKIGMPFENEIASKLNDVGKLEIINISETVTKRHYNGACATCCGGENGNDPHIWLGINVMEEAMNHVRMEVQTRFETQEALGDCRPLTRALEAELRTTLANYEGRKFYVFHPTYGYFADTFGLEQVAIEIEGKEPTAKQLRDLVRQARAEGIKTIFVQPQFATKSAETIANAIGADVVVLDPLSEDWADSMRDIATKLAIAFAREDAAA